MTSSNICFIRLPEVSKRLAMGKSTILAMVARGDFPKAVKLNQKNVAWPESVVNDWALARVSLAKQQR